MCLVPSERTAKEMDDKFDANLCIKFMYAGGLLNDWCQSRQEVNLCRILGFFSLFWCVVYGSLSLAVLFTQEVTLSMITEILSVCSAGLLGTAKAALMLRRAGDFAAVARRLRRPLPLLPAGLAGAAEQRRAVAEANRRASFITRALLYLCVSITVSWDLLPYLYSRCSGRLLFHRVTYHFTDVTKFPGFEIEVAINCVGTLFAMIVLIASDCFTHCIAIYIAMHMRLLNVATATLKQRAREIHRQGKGHSVAEHGKPAGTDDPDLARLAHQLLKNCARQHVQVLKLASTVQDLIRWMLLMQFQITTCIICVNVFQIAKSSEDLTATSKFVSYLMTTIIDLYLYCSYGEQIRHESQELSLACYGCGWYGAGPQFASTLRLMMLRASRPVVLAAGHIYKLTLETFVHIIQASYSMCTLLLTVDEEK